MNLKYRMAIVGAAALAAGSISACGGGGAGQTAAMPPPTVTGLSLDTAQVLARAWQSSETSSPSPVNDGMLVLTDTSDTTEPVSVNGS